MKIKIRKNESSRCVKRMQSLSVSNYFAKDKKTGYAIFAYPVSVLVGKDRLRRLSLDDCTCGASSGATSAANAFVSIYFVDVAFRYSLYGALSCACSTCNAVFSYYVSHLYKI